MHGTPRGRTTYSETGAEWTAVVPELERRQAYDLGYDVIAVSDAITDRSLAAHANVLPVIGRLTTSAELLG